MATEREDEDLEDIFDSSLFTLFSIPPIGFAPNSKNGYYTYKPPLIHDNINFEPVKLKIPEPPSKFYNTLQAQLIWPSSIYLADLIFKEIIKVKDKTVIELGSAAGLPGIISYLKDAQKVISTDYPIDEVLNVLKDNFQRAEFSKTKGAEEGHGKKCEWEVLGHCWGQDTSELIRSISFQSDEPPDTPQSKFDVVLAADVLWTTSSHSILLDSISALLSKSGVVHITAGLHTGRGPVERLLNSARERGFQVDYKGEVRLRGDGGWDMYDESLAVKGEEERGVVVWFTLQFME
ncbi:uncharacterized protein I206_105642 [Kwoniella pini CBS 10737]|uniref:Nicotinamide N-methyltransferase n=1 Tax=Kwoniella pini CBS 10737 TaxID=1296096 RepID=A0A1B9I3N1_9TREE|nr:uncharacterized protein I206_03458 [Kwoniella pini CBS 10737]OCF50139.1 hypothetical protein I206_03458 [Kwoniella pini CBS 10737]